jgi:uncharacterized protein YjlB
MVTVIQLDERGFVPNNPRLPVLFYHKAFQPKGSDLAAEMEQIFALNGWPPQWRNGIYDFDHYHSKGHEVLGIAAGTADLVIGGKGGRALPVAAGDVLLLPAGTGHRKIRSDSDFLVIGAYPPGQSGDIIREEATPEIRKSIARLTFPPSDPVLGHDGPLSQHWADALSPKPRRWSER